MCAKLYKKKQKSKKTSAFLRQTPMDYFPWCSLDTVRDLRPLRRRAARTRRPLAVCIRRRKPCLLILLRLCGWNVLFILLLLFLCYY